MIDSVHKFEEQGEPSLPIGPLTLGRRDRKLQATREHLFACAWALFDTHGFDSVAMEAIAQSADVARGTLYNHFPTKEAFIQIRFHRDAAAQRDSTVALVMGKMTTADRLAELLRLTGDYAERMRQYVGPYLHYRLAGLQSVQHPIERDTFEGIVVDILRRGQRSGEVSVAMQVEDMAEHLVFLRVGTLVRWLARGGGRIQPYFDELTMIFLHGVSTR